VGYRRRAFYHSGAKKKIIDAKKHSQPLAKSGLKQNGALLCDRHRLKETKGNGETIPKILLRDDNKGE